MRSSHLVLGLSLFAAALLPTDRSAAQSVYGQVSGHLTSPSGTPVSGARISVAAVGTGAVSKVTSDSSGLFTINNLTADLYKIEVVADGFTPIHGDVAVNADTTTSVNATLHAGPGPATPTSIGTGPLQLDRNDVSTLFDSQAIADLPLLDANITRLQLLVPGAAKAKLSIAPNQNPQGSQPVNINGQYFSGSAFQLDGTENRDPLEGIVIINPALDSVREMKVTTQGYNAEFGQATAGVVTVQTLSGTNSWHGQGFGYRRTGFGLADDPFSLGIPPQKNAIFGGSIGGPIVRDKLFIFGNYQGTRSSAGANVLLNVPTDTVQETCLGSKGPPGSFCDLSEYSDFINGNLHDDNQHLGPDGKPIQYSDNKIPNSRISDQAVALLNMLPKHNQLPAGLNCGTDAVVCDNYLVSGNEAFDGDQFGIRSDYIASSRLRVFGRYSFGDYRDRGMPAFGIFAGGTGTNPTGFAGITNTRNQGIGAGLTYTLSPKMLTDVRFGFVRYRLNNNSPDNAHIPDIGIPNIFPPDTPDPFATGIPEIQIPGQKTTKQTLASSLGSDYIRFGYSPITNNCNCPLSEREQQFQFVNNWTRTAGKHVVKWGADLRYLQNYRLASDDRRTGFFSFAPGITGLSLATFLIGDVTTFERFVSTPAAVDAGERQKRFGFYGQDTWRINSRLTLNFGIRWELYFPQTVNASGGFLLPSFSNPDPASTFFTVGPLAGASGTVADKWTNLAPRFGFAYLLNPSTVIRAGYGRSFDAGYAGDIFGIAPTQDPPVTADQQIEAGGFNLAQGPPPFMFPAQAHFSLLDLAAANVGNQTVKPKIPTSGAVLYALPSRMRVPTVDSWNLTIQHEFTSHLFFEIAYVGNKGTDIFTDSNNNSTYYNLNQTSLTNIIIRVPFVNNTLDTSNCRNKNAIFKDPNDPTRAFCLSQPQLRSFYLPDSFSSDKCQNDTCTFDPTLFPVRYFGNNASNNYNSLQGRVQKNFSGGYSFMAHYTWAKGLDYDSNYFRVDPKVGYGPATFDVSHRFVLTNILDLPFGRGRKWFGGISNTADRFVGGWTLSAITVWRSGLPFTPSYSSCAQDVDASSPCRPNVVG